jgi:hypothetical protein
MKTYRVYRIRRTEKSAEPEFVDVPAISQEHAKSVAVASYSWMSSEIECADEFHSDWTGPLWYVIDRDRNFVENEDKSLMEFALEDEARKSISGLPEQGYDIRRESAFRVRNGLWRRKGLDV